MPVMAQLLMQARTGEFMGRYVYVAEGSKGFDAVPVAEHGRSAPRYRQRSAKRSFTRKITKRWSSTTAS